MTRKPKPLPKLEFTRDKTTGRVVTHEQRFCGVCLFERIEIVKLGVNEICPECGADYGRDQDS